MSEIRAVVAHCASMGMKPIVQLRRYVIGRILMLVAALYFLVMFFYYFTANDYHSIFPSGLPWPGFKWNLVSPKLKSTDYQTHRALGDGPFQLGDVLQFVQKSTQAEFSWSDWIDLSPVKKYSNVSKADAKRLFSANVNFNEQTAFERPISSATELDLAINGKMYLSRNSRPNMTVVLLGDNAGHYAIGNNDSQFLLDAKHESLKPLASIFDSPPEERLQIPFDVDLFDFDIETLIQRVDDPDHFKREHAKNIGEWWKAAPKAPKYFEECYLKEDPYYYGNHYDWRFFNGVRKGLENVVVQHHLMRAWSQFAEQEKIITWISHGSLLGWYWNGFAMPWDTDNDIQMPIIELDRFAQLYNQTIIVEDPKEGNGRFFVDMSPWYVQRVRGEGLNVIDGRFIDIDTGMYIDITGLASTGKSPQRVHCKNHHYYRVKDLQPLTRTLYEGRQVYRPNQYDSILAAEYPNYKKMSFGAWRFDRGLRMWVNKNKCRNFQDVCRQKERTGELTLYGACNDMLIFRDYNITSELTALHNHEMKYWNDGKEDDLHWIRSRCTKRKNEEELPSLYWKGKPDDEIFAIVNREYPPLYNI